LRDLGIHSVDRLDAEQREVLLVVLRRTRLTGDEVAGAEPETAYLARTDVDVVGRGEEGAATEEPEAVLDDLEDPLGEDVALRFGLRLQDTRDDVLLVHVGGDVGDAELLRDAEEILRLRLGQLGDRVPLAHARFAHGTGAPTPGRCGRCFARGRFAADGRAVGGGAVRGRDGGRRFCGGFRGRGGLFGVWVLLWVFHAVCCSLGVLCEIAVSSYEKFRGAQRLGDALSPGKGR